MDQEKNDAELILKNQFMKNIKYNNEDFLIFFKDIAKTIAKIIDN